MRKRFWGMLSKGIAVGMAAIMMMPGAMADFNVEAKAIDTADSVGRVKNVIYMIPDGGGYPSYDIAKAVKEAGGLKSVYSQSGFTGTVVNNENSKMYMDDYLVGSVITNSYGGVTTDSAAAATALATGGKTYNNYVGVDKNYTPKATLLELAQLEGKSVGMAVTTYINDATPAGFSAHAKDRHEYYTIFKQQRYTDIDLALGGGLEYGGHSGMSGASSKLLGLGCTLVGTETELYNATRNWTEKGSIWSTFSVSSYSMPYDAAYGVSSYFDIKKTSVEPTLAEMTQYSIDYLNQDPDGFFLMVEGSKIDYGGHHGNAFETACEYIAFDEAFKVALDFAKADGETMVVVVPDHNTGYAGTPSSSNMKSLISTLQSCTSSNVNMCRDYLVLDGGNNKGEYSHTSMNVGIWMILPEGVDTISGLSGKYLTAESERNESKNIIDNTKIAPYIASLIGDMTLEEATNELYIKVSKDKYSYNSSTDKVTIYGSKHTGVALNNTDLCTVDDETLDMGGQLTIYIDNNCYISKKLATYLGIVDEVEVDFEGKGTEASPYLISSEADFLKFTNRLASGVTYDGVYFKQTKNIDMTEDTVVGSYKGLGKNASFSGHYNGQGHRINVNISSSASDGTAVFPYTNGTVMNLGITGKIVNTEPTSLAAGLCRSLQTGGQLINCYVTADIENANCVGGIAWTVYSGATVQNCHFIGKLTGESVHGIGYFKDGGTVNSCYYKLESGSTAETEANSCGISATDFSAEKLNSILSDAVSNISSITTKDQLCKYIDIEGEKLAFEGSVARLSDFTITYQVKGGNGSKKTVSLNELTDFDGTPGSYSANAPSDLYSNGGIIAGGVGAKTAPEVVVEEMEGEFSNYGFAGCEVKVTATASTSYYKTSTLSKYIISMTGEPPESLPTVKLSASSIKVKPGNTVTVTADISGGMEPYTCQYVMYKKGAESDMDTTAYGAVTQKTYTFNSEGEYHIYANVKDDNGKSAVSEEVIITVQQQDSYEITGSGTKDDPYVICSEETFLIFTNMMYAGETFAGKYLIQTKNIDMTKIPEYVGIGAQTDANGQIISFAGTYNGQGHTINVNIVAESEEGISLFPYITGRVMNIGTTGYIENTAATSGVCGVVRSVRDGGLVYNTWSTVDLVSNKDAGGITYTIKSGGQLWNSYYKGKITTVNNYGVGIMCSGSTVGRCYYQMESGSTAISTSSTNTPGGESTTDFSAATLNSYQERAVANVSEITTEAQLCDFVDIDGKEFAFAGSVAKLTDMTVSYSTKAGAIKKISISDFAPDKLNYQINLSDADSSKSITVSGTALSTGGNEKVSDSVVKADASGKALASVVVATDVKTDYYSTSETEVYSVNITVPVNEVLAITASADKSTCNVGESVVITAKATGGSGNYTYSFLVWNTDSDEWHRFNKVFNSNSSITWKAGSAGNRKFYAEVKDDSGKVVRTKAVAVKVNKGDEALKVTASSSAWSVNCGTTVTITAKATGGSGKYTYSFLVWNVDSNLWYRFNTTFSSNNVLTWKAGSAGNRRFFAEVKDSTGKVVRSQAVSVSVN